MNTGARQECVFSPFLFTLYTNDCVPSLPNNIFIKFYDSALVSLLTKTCEWCNVNSFQENEKKKKKTKEMVVDPREVFDRSPVYINNEEIERVSNLR